MKRSRKLLLTATICGAVGFGVMDAKATDVDVDATLTASAAVAIAKSADIDFGGVDFVGGHSGTLELGPDGNIALGGGSLNLTLTGTPTAAQLDVTSAVGTIEITCDATAIIDDAASTALTLTTVKWDPTAATYGAAANTCGGVGVGAVAIDTAVSNNPSLYIGAELTINNNDLNGSSGGTPFDTSTGTGDPITFRVVFQ